MNINEASTETLLNNMHVDGVLAELERRHVMVSPSGKTFRVGTPEQSAKWAKAGWTFLTSN